MVCSNPTSVTATEIDMSNKEDFQAIEHFFTNAHPTTQLGAQFKRNFEQFAPRVSSLFYIRDNDLLHAENIRDNYNRAEGLIDLVVSGEEIHRSIGNAYRFG